MFKKSNDRILPNQYLCIILKEFAFSLLMMMMRSSEDKPGRRRRNRTEKKKHHLKRKN
jgi:hypothetical protein